METGDQIVIKKGDASYFVWERGEDWFITVLSPEDSAGEGMSISEDNLFDLIDGYFKKNF